MKKPVLTSNQEAIAYVIKNLDPGQRISRIDMMNHAGIKDGRTSYSTVEELRNMHFMIGSSKRCDDKGYYRIWTPDDLQKTVQRFRTEGATAFKMAATLENAYKEELKRGYSLFDLI